MASFPACHSESSNASSTTLCAKCMADLLGGMYHSPLKIFDQAKCQGRFLYACAPMVRYSKVCKS